MPRVNALERLSCRARRSQPGLKREMRRLATAPEKVFPDAVDEGDGEGLGVGLGVGEGIMFSQRCNGTLAPPISFTSVSHRAWILSKSGGPNGFSAVPGENDVTHLQIAHRPIVGCCKRVEFFCDAQRCLANFVVGTNVSDDGWINRIAKNHERVIAHFNRIGATGKRARHHDERIGRADQETKLFQRANLVA